MKNKTALITGITGQDGSFLTKLLLEKEYKVFGVVRSTSDFSNFKALDIDENRINKITFEEINSIASEVDEVYNFAGQTKVAQGWVDPVGTYEANFIFFSRLIEIFKDTNSKILQASSAEMFGKFSGKANELTAMNPQNPYAISKYAAYKHGEVMRNSKNLKISNVILFNHESELRGPEFLTRKVSLNVVKRASGKKEILEIGNLDIQRDWGYAKEYVEAMYLIMQSDISDDYVIATGSPTKIRNFIETAFNVINIEIEWEGQGLDEKGFDKNSRELLVRVNPEFYRPADVEIQSGDSAKIKKILNWEPIVTLEELAAIMVQSDIKNKFKG